MKAFLKSIAFAMLIASVIAVTSCNNNKNQKEMATTDNTPLFPKGEKLSNEWFSGNAFLHPMLGKDKNNEFALGSVTFEAGARTHWHTHPKGQVLIITEGEGFYQEKGKPAQRIKKAMWSIFPKTWSIGTEQLPLHQWCILP